MSNIPPPPPPTNTPTNTPADLPEPPSYAAQPPYEPAPYQPVYDPSYDTSGAPVEQVNRPSLGRGILFGIGAGIVGGLAWYLIVAGTKRQFLYGAAVLGLFVGWAVVKGAGQAGAPTAIAATLIALITVVVAYYYIDRYLMIVGAEDAGISLNIPLLPGFSDFKEVLKFGFREEKSQWLFSGVAVVAAALIGATGGRNAAQYRRG